MRSVDIVGYVASALVLITFYMKDMVALRIAAICSNVAFLAYGGGIHLAPIIFLHGLLLPLNIWRLTTALDWRRTLAFTLHRTSDKPRTRLPSSA